MQGNLADDISFERILFSLISKENSAIKTSELLKHLSLMDYGSELAFKSKAIAQFWDKNRLRYKKGIPLTPSPLPRHYRTTTKRKASIGRNGFTLNFSEDGKGSPYGVERAANLEPQSDSDLFALLEETINGKRYGELSKAINFIIIRGDYEKRSVIFNISAINGHIVNNMRSIVEEAAEKISTLVSAHSFFDPTRSRYYLDFRGQPKGKQLKTLFGRPKIELKYGHVRYKFTPTVFSQVNGSMVVPMIETVERLLSPEKNRHLIDLFCGYGLFTHAFASKFNHVIGIEANRDSAYEAISNSKLNHTDHKVRIYIARIGKGIIKSVLAKTQCHPEYFLCDPPRQGMDSHTIAEICTRRPEKVVVACCGIDALPTQVEDFRRNGYNLANVEVLDMFPGTPHLETLMLFTP